MQGRHGGHQWSATRQTLHALSQLTTTTRGWGGSPPSKHTSDVMDPWKRSTLISTCPGVLTLSDRPPFSLNRGKAPQPPLFQQDQSVQAWEQA
jgi:hypothetical protein